jgi:hypothetical protein
VNIIDERFVGKTVTLDSIPERTFFTGDIGGYSGLFFKGLTVTIKFESGYYWSPAEHRTATVRNYQPVEVEIRILKNINPEVS